MRKTRNMRAASGALFSWALALAAGCNRTPPEDKAPPPPPRADSAAHHAPAAPAVFTPPSDGRVTPEQLQRYRVAQDLVLALDGYFLDSLSRVPAEAKAGVTAGLDLARDKACRKAGLRGYDEYRWILRDASRDPANRDAFARAGITLR